MQKRLVWWMVIAVCIVAGPRTLRSQVYSPEITKVGQVDTSNMASLVQGIYRQYNATTDREKAEAIWRFYLTDGRFVKPGMFYHLLGYAYEEPNGQVLDPIKLLNSYGFGLCYQDGPLMAATYDAGGFKHSRVWFLTGHTVAEVYYDGAYHMFDSDELGYNPIGSGPLKLRDVASVWQLEHDGSIITKNVTGPTTSNPKTVDYPWYPADVRAGDMKGLAELYTSINDNYLYAYRRYPEGRTMDFVLRPGERMVRYYRPTPAGTFYLPYTYDGKDWKIAPDFAQFHLSPSVGPRSEKDARMWATGKIEYRPTNLSDNVSRNGDDATYTFSMPSPYVIIDAHFSVQASLPTAENKLTAETSVDGGRSWTASGSLAGPFNGPWEIHAADLPGAHGHRTAVSGTYGYLVRFSLHGAGNQAPSLQNVFLTTTFQLNPRTIPTLTPGENHFEYRAGKDIRTELPVRPSHLSEYAAKVENSSYVAQDGQGYWINDGDKVGDVIFEVSANDRDLSGFDVGGRFLDLTDGIAPDKFTAEIRHVTAWPANRQAPGAASIAWSTGSDGPWKTLWTYNPKLTWLDGQPVKQVLRWPEVDRSVRGLPAGTRRVYVRYQFSGLAIDHFRLASIRPENPSATQHLKITQIWEENGAQHEFHKAIPNANVAQSYQISIPKQADVTNVAFILDCPPK
ncbi:MAG TPA: hypothetical protein VE195_10815 [Acidobacteriaceae bacterium]|nr:hypothetical protein [Acidobacteriaceae bacterium]